MRRANSENGAQARSPPETETQGASQTLPGHSRGGVFYAGLTEAS